MLLMVVTPPASGMVNARQKFQRTAAVFLRVHTHIPGMLALQQEGRVLLSALADPMQPAHRDQASRRGYTLLATE